MSTLVIAKKDFEDAIRARTLQLMVAFFTVFLTFLFHYYRSRLGDERTFAALFDGIVGMLGIVVPVLGVMLGYKAIVGERESGSLKLLLTLPHTRRDVMVGKFLGRSAIVVVTMLVGFTVVGIQTALLTNLFSLIGLVVAVGKVTLFGVVYVAIAIAFSTAMRSSMTATIGAIGVTIVFSFLWDIILTVLSTFIRPLPGPGAGTVTPEPLPDWFFLLKRLNPRHALKDATVFGVDAAPFYLDTWFGIVILGGWLFVPLGLAYLRFQWSDIK